MKLGHSHPLEAAISAESRLTAYTNKAVTSSKHLLGNLRRAVHSATGDPTPPKKPAAKAPKANSAAVQRVKVVEAELERVRKVLTDTRAELRRTRATITEASYNLPEAVEDVIARAREERLTYLKADYLRNLATVVRDIEAQGVPGLIIEAGTALGGSAIVLGAAKEPKRPMKVYDVFGMIPPPTDEDGADVHKRYAKILQGDARGFGDDVYYGYRDNLLGEVTESFSRLGVPAEENNIDLVPGLFQDTIDLDEPVAFAHLDGDWYESTMTCLTRIAPLISPGGRIVLDDYYAWSGCRKAVDEYFRGRQDFRLEKRAKVHVIKV